MIGLLNGDIKYEWHNPGDIIWDIVGIAVGRILGDNKKGIHDIAGMYPVVSSNMPERIPPASQV